MTKKEQARELYRRGAQVGTIASQLDVPLPTISHWLSDCRDRWDISLSGKWLREPLRRMA